jgi:hypothetical protein
MTLRPEAGYRDGRHFATRIGFIAGNEGFIGWEAWGQVSGS